MKFFTSRKTAPSKYAALQRTPPPIDYPVTAKPHDKYLAVAMSPFNLSAEYKWGTVNFQSSDIEGIYTAGLTSCCAVSIIRENAAHEVEQVWLSHLPGGLDLEKLPDFPEHPVENTNYQVIIKFGTEEVYDRFDPESFKQEIAKKYPQIAIENIHAFSSSNQHPSFAINKDGQVGCKPLQLPDIFGISEQRHTVQVNLADLSKGDISEQIQWESQHISELIADKPIGHQEAYKFILKEIEKHSKTDQFSALKALIYTHSYLSCDPQDPNQYLKNMKSITPNWGKIGKLLLLSVFIFTLIYTAPKISNQLNFGIKIADQLLRASQDSIEQPSKPDFSR
jgi:hypothetical protein